MVLVYHEVFSRSPELIQLTIACLLVTFIVAVTKHSTRINLKFCLTPGSGDSNHQIRKALWKKCEVIGYIMTTVRNQGKMNAVTEPASLPPLLTSASQPIIYGYSDLGFPLSYGNTIIDTLKGMSH